MTPPSIPPSNGGWKPKSRQGQIVAGVLFVALVVIVVAVKLASSH